MADDDLAGIGVVGAVVVALMAANGSFSSADAAPLSTVLISQVGQHLTMNKVHVRSVPADEGFWIDTDHGRAWVQIATVSESPYTVEEGDTVSFSGDVVTNGANFPARVGVTSAEGAADLDTQGAHIRIPVDALTFDR